jgi:hypothetical protein
VSGQVHRLSARRRRRGIGQTSDDSLNVQFFVPIDSSSPRPIILGTPTTYSVFIGEARNLFYWLPKPGRKKKETSDHLYRVFGLSNKNTNEI